MLTKIQYNNFETGEFTEEKGRTFEETIQLIEAFPWQQQREHYSVGLDGPSITIQGPNDDFLRLAPFYNGKFVLYYYKKPKTLYDKTFQAYADAYPFIQAYFVDTQEFDPSAFHQQNTWLRELTSHFQTHNFQYALTDGRLLSNATPILYLFCCSMTLTLASVLSARLRPVLFGAAISWAFFSYFLVLFLNHYKASKGQVLILSKGLDDFAYGPANDPVWMKKTDIVELITYGRPSKGGYPATTRVEVTLKEGNSVNISCFLIPWLDLMQKFPGTPQRVVGIWSSFIPRDASTPS